MRSEQNAPKVVQIDGDHLKMRPIKQNGLSFLDHPVPTKYIDDR